MNAKSSRFVMRSRSAGLLLLAFFFDHAFAKELIAPVSAPALSAMSGAIRSKEFKRIEAVLIDHSGSIIFEGYFGDSTAESRVDARSAGKSITALAVGAAIDDGYDIRLDAPAWGYFDEQSPFKHDGPMKRAITIADLLSMSSALDCSDWRSSPGNEERMYRQKDWTRFALDIPVDENYRRAPNGQGRFSYCTAGVFLLGRIIEKAVGEPFEAYVQRRIFDPLGIRDPIWRRSPKGKAQSGGQLSLTARDFRAAGRVVMNGGAYNGQQIISADWIREMGQPRVQATPDAAYGYLWWFGAFEFEEELYGAAYMSGNGGNKVVLMPQLDAVIVILSTNYNKRNMHEQTARLIEEYILPALLGETANGTRAPD